MPYFDTTAFASLFIADVHSKNVEAHVVRDRSQLIVSDLTLIEFSAVVGKVVRQRRTTDESAQLLLHRAESWTRSLATRFEMSPSDVRIADAHVRRFALGLRAPDAIHIAICQRLGLRLATCDDTQARAARALGVDVINLSAGAIA